LRDSPFIQGRYRGVNRLCRRCAKNGCKQFENTKVIRCNFVAKVSKDDNGACEPLGNPPALAGLEK
jgi:hypothetical protein